MAMGEILAIISCKVSILWLMLAIVVVSRCGDSFRGGGIGWFSWRWSEGVLYWQLPLFIILGSLTPCDILTWCREACWLDLLPLMLRSSQQRSVWFAPTPSYHYFTDNTSESNLATSSHHSGGSGGILTLPAIERAIAAPLPSWFFNFLIFISSFSIEMFLVWKQCNIIKWLANNWIATLKKHMVMSPDGFDKVNKLVYDLPMWLLPQDFPT